MIFIKSPEEIAVMQEASLILSKLHGLVAENIKPGVTTITLDKLAEEFVRDNGASPSFKGYRGFPHTLCTSVNDCVVHGVPNIIPLKDGDILSVDSGVYYKAFHSDSAFTHFVGEVGADIKKLLKVTEESLYIGIKVINCGGGVRVGDIGYAIQNYVQSHGFSVVRELVGHGVGRSLHESPDVPNYGAKGTGVKIKNGMVLAIEPMVNMGRSNIVRVGKFEIKTLDKKLSAHFEHTVAVVDGMAQILTTFDYIKKNIAY